MTKKMKRGFTLTEIAIVLGIMGLILGAIWAAAAAVYGSQRMNNASNQVAQIVQSVRKVYSTANAIDPVSTNITGDLVLAGQVPTAMMRASPFTYAAAGDIATNYLVGPFPNGRTGIYSTSDGNGFVISMSQVTKANCISILTSIGGASRDGGLFLAVAESSTDHPAIQAVAASAPLAADVTTGVAAAAASASVTNAGGCTGDTTHRVRLGFTVK